MEPNTTLGNGSDVQHGSGSGSTSPLGAASTASPASSSPTWSPGQVDHIRCVTLRELQLTQAICLDRDSEASCEDFVRSKGAKLASLLCPLEPGPEACTWLAAQSQVRPSCLLLVDDNQTELADRLHFLKDHEAALQKLGIQRVTQDKLGQHQSSSRKTLIALVTSGILLAVLGLAGYFLMNRRSWSPAGERLGEDPYHSEAGAAPAGAPDAQGKSGRALGGRENGTSQAAPRNGHSGPQQAVADTPL